MHFLLFKQHNNIISFYRCGTVGGANFRFFTVLLRSKRNKNSNYFFVTFPLVLQNLKKHLASFGLFSVKMLLRDSILNQRQIFASSTIATIININTTFHTKTTKATNTTSTTMCDHDDQPPQLLTSTTITFQIDNLKQLCK